ncbi:MAG TPA: hypothetical protein DCY35_06515 [Prolixibacteraceae bacterium]|nr:hypothetical protein [Prolixibacteraceae bacterium]
MENEPLQGRTFFRPWAAHCFGTVVFVPVAVPIRQETLNAGVKIIILGKMAKICPTKKMTSLQFS